VATGRYYDSNDEIQGLIEMLSNGTWTATEAPLPPGAASDSSVDFLALACPSVGSCVATGYYVDASGDGQGLIETLSSGTWTAMKAPVPAGAASDPATWLSAVACPSVGSCVATGRYFDPSFDSQIVIETLSAGTWTAMKAPFPPGAVASHGNTGPGVLACASVGSCVATGSYTDSNDRRQGFIDTLSDGTWTAMKAPVPAGAASWPAALLGALACPSVGSCVLTGTYVDSNGDLQDLIDTLSDGTWTAMKAPAPDGAASDPNAFLRVLACPSVGSCVATGYYGDASGDGQGLIETLSSGTWTPTEAPLPLGAASDPDAGLEGALACPSVGSCVATGVYTDSSGDQEGLIEEMG
jgi:hypothetical protein